MVIVIVRGVSEFNGMEDARCFEGGNCVGRVVRKRLRDKQFVATGTNKHEIWFKCVECGQRRINR